MREGGSGAFSNHLFPPEGVFKFMDSESFVAGLRCRECGRTYPVTPRVACDCLAPLEVMYDVEGYTHEEIGAVLEIPSGTSKARLSRARAKLRESLAEFAGDWA